MYVSIHARIFIHMCRYMYLGNSNIKDLAGLPPWNACMNALESNSLMTSSTLQDGLVSINFKQSYFPESQETSKSDHS